MASSNRLDLTEASPGRPAMTGAGSSHRANRAAGRGHGEGGQIIPFPRGGDGVPLDDDRWEFRTEVHWVGGADGKWLRRELAGVLRELLTWARDDMTGDFENDGEEQAA